MPLPSNFCPSALRAGCTTLFLAAAAHAQQALPTAEACAKLPDDTARLACYDHVFQPHAADGTPLPPPSPATAPVTAPAAVEAATDPDASLLSKAWELGKDEKRGTFAVRTYAPNFFLPIHESSSIGTPHSPTHPAATSTEPQPYRRTEAKMQISLRTKALEDFGLPGADLWLAYTQHSLWQLYTPGDSSPFRATDYQPEVVYVVPIRSKSWSDLPGGWRWRMVQLGMEHESNGQSDPLSRSWNRAYLGTAFDDGPFGLQLRTEKRTWETGVDDNPDIARYMGRQLIEATWLGEHTVAALTWRTNFYALKTGSVQFDWSYPVDEKRPDGLRWYVQLFSGYGETLIDYNHHQSSIGLGLTLFQF